MKKLFYNFILLFLSFFTNISLAYAQISQPLSITVSGVAEISNTAGGNSLISINWTNIPSIGATNLTNTSSIKVRANTSTWKVQMAKSTANDNETINDSEISLSFTKTAGSTGSISSGNIQGGITSLANLSNTPITVLQGSSKTSSALDNRNSNNYLELNTTYSLVPDFFHNTKTFPETHTITFIITPI